MVTHGIPYHLFYTTNIGMNIPVFALAWVAFRNLHALPRHPNEWPVEEGAAIHAFGATLRSREVWTLAVFLMLYVGAEDSIGGWMVSCILEVCTGSPEGASWVASCFYLGVAISALYAPAITTGGKLVPRSMHADALALMSAVGQSGSAFWPLMVGIISTKKGVWVAEPTVVALLDAQGICWLLVPKVSRRPE